MSNKPKLPKLHPDAKWVQIPFPQPTQHVNRGFFVSGAEPTKPRSIRFTDEEFVRLCRVSESLGVSFSEFVRWCAAFAAVEIANEQHRQTFQSAKTSKPVDTTGWT